MTPPHNLLPREKARCPGRSRDTNKTAKKSAWREAERGTGSVQSGFTCMCGRGVGEAGCHAVFDFSLCTMKYNEDYRAKMTGKGGGTIFHTNGQISDGGGGDTPCSWHAGQQSPAVVSDQHVSTSEAWVRTCGSFGRTGTLTFPNCSGPVFMALFHRKWHHRKWFSSAPLHPIK